LLYVYIKLKNMAIPAAAAAVVAGLGAVVPSVTSVFNTGMSIRAQKELAKYSYQKDLDMWNISNAYNSPTAQMERLKSAGLNPNLVYGSGTVAGNTTSASPPRYNQTPPKYDYVAPRADTVLSTLGQFQDLRYKTAQADIASANAKVAEEMANNRNMDLFYRVTRGYYQTPQRSADTGEMLYADPILQENLRLLRQQWDQRGKLFPSTLAQTNANVANIKSMTLSKDLENKLNKLGLQKSDNLLLRVLIQNGGVDWLKKSYPAIFKNFSPF
jgi:hypothetical protein